LPVLRTDDIVRRQRAIWLGPPGHRWPIDATYVAWAVGFAAVIVWVGTGLLLGVVLGGKTFWPLGGLLGVVAAWSVTRAVLRVVDHDRPLRYWRQALTDEHRGRRVRDAPTIARIEIAVKRAP
jgi:hypothetical protein